MHVNCAAEPQILSLPITLLATRSELLSAWIGCQRLLGWSSSRRFPCLPAVLRCRPTLGILKASVNVYLACWLSCQKHTKWDAEHARKQRLRHTHYRLNLKWIQLRVSKRCMAEMECTQLAALTGYNKQTELTLLHCNCLLLTRVLGPRHVSRYQHRWQRQIGRNIMPRLGEIWAEKILFRLCCANVEF